MYSLLNLERTESEENNILYSDVPINDTYQHPRFNGSLVLEENNNIHSKNETVSGVPSEFYEISSSSWHAIYAYVIIFVFSATGNLSVFFSLLKQLRKLSASARSRINILILNLSIADLLVTFCEIPLEIFWRLTVQWMGGNILCKLCKFFSAFGLYLSSMVLICISLDRYFVIIYPLRVTEARRKVRIMLVMAWITAVLCSIPQLLVFRVETHPDYPSFQQCVSLGVLTRSEELMYTIFSLIFMYFLPLLIVVFTCFSILLKINRKTKQQSRNELGGLAVDSRRLTSLRISSRVSSVEDSSCRKIILRRNETCKSSMERAKSRSLRLTMIIILTFLFCWTPYCVITLWYMLDRQSASMLDGKVQETLFIMAVANSCLNPYVYYGSTKDCKDTITNCFCSSKCFKDQNHSRMNQRKANFHQVSRNRSRSRFLQEDLITKQETLRY